MHLNDGELRALRDHELPDSQRKRAEAHLSGCTRCQAAFDSLADRATYASARLSVLAPGAKETPISARPARARFDDKINSKEKLPMSHKIFARPYRTAWIVLGLVAILAIALAFPSVRAVANSFLGLFRVQQIALVQVDPGNLPNQLESSKQFESLFTEDFQVEELGEPRQVADAAEASAAAGIPVRLPASLEGEQNLEVQPGAKASFKVDLPKMRALLKDIGRDDLQLPDAIDGAQVTMELPTAVLASYGKCEMTTQEAREAGFDPDNPESPFVDCTRLVQLASPSINAPEGLDLARLGEVFLQLLGMNPDEAARFSQTVDWTTTLVVPVPRYETSYQEVSVDGVQGWFIEEAYSRSDEKYMLIWIKDGVVYALSGPGDQASALAIAGSLK